MSGAASAQGSRPDAQIVALREEQAWHYRTQGWTQERIAEKLGVGQSAVSRMLRRIVERVVFDMEIEVKEELLAQLAELRFIVGESMEAWEKSKAGSKRVSRATQKQQGPALAGKSPADLGEIVTTRQDLVDTYGNTQFLNLAMKAMGDIRTLLQMEVKQVSISWQQFVPEGYNADLVIDEFARLMVSAAAEDDNDNTQVIDDD